MKKFLTIAVAALMLCSCGNQKSYTIIGDIEGLEGSITLTLVPEGDELTTVDVKDGKFTIKGKANIPQIGVLADEFEPLAAVFLEPGIIYVTGTEEEGIIKVTGTPSNDASTAFQEKQTELMMALFFGGGGEEEREALIDEYQNYELRTLEDNMDNYFGLIMLSNFVNTWEPTKVLETLDMFPKELQSTEAAIDIRTTMENAAKTGVNGTYIDITLPDNEENNQTLSSYVKDNKFVLLNFWRYDSNASKEEIVVHKEVYEEYHDQGFEIYSISIDDHEQTWLLGLNEYEPEWINVYLSQGANDENDIITQYAITQLPTTLLINSEGVIVARNIYGEELKEKLAELF